MADENHEHSTLLDPLCHTINWSINLAQERMETEKDTRLINEVIHLLAVGVGSILSLIKPEHQLAARQLLNTTIDEATYHPTVGRQ